MRARQRQLYEPSSADSLETTSQSNQEVEQDEDAEEVKRDWDINPVTNRASTIVPINQVTNRASTIVPFATPSRTVVSAFAPDDRTGQVKTTRASPSLQTFVRSPNVSVRSENEELAILHR